MKPDSFQVSLFTDQTAKRTRSQIPLFKTRSSRRLKPTVAFDSYWHLAHERQAMLFRRLRGDQVLTHDPILRRHRFTNAYRAADRVSQYFIRTVVGKRGLPANDIVFRTLLFKTFNKIETWEALENSLQEPILSNTFTFDRYDLELTKLMVAGQKIYSNAYMMPIPAFGFKNKHSNHLKLIIDIMHGRLLQDIQRAGSLKTLYEVLLSVPSLGPFLAFQYAIDLNYSTLFDFDESEFVVAGPGAIDGIRKCFEDVDSVSPVEIIEAMVDGQADHFDRLGLKFESLWGRPLQLIDCQNLFCEVDKYSRVKHPQLLGDRGRVRIKQRYTTSAGPLPEYEFPARWNLDPTHIPDVPKLPFW